MEPAPALEVRRRPSLFSELTSNSEASTSITTGSPSSTRSNSPEVAAARPARSRASVGSSIASKVRHTVASEATSPNRDDWLRNTAVSVTHRPPAASVNATCVSSRPRSYFERRCTVGAIASLRELERQLEQLGDTTDKMGADLGGDPPTTIGYSNPLHHVGSVHPQGALRPRLQNSTLRSLAPPEGTFTHPQQSLLQDQS